MLVLPSAAFAQTPQLVPASTFGEGWKEMTKTGQAGKASVKYVKTGGQEVEISIENLPSDKEVDNTLGLVAGMVAAFGGKVEPAADYGAKGVKVTMSDPTNPKTSVVGFIWADGTVVTSIGATAGSAADADAIATKGAVAQKALGSPAPAPAPAKPAAAAPATAPTQDDAKAVSIGLSAFPAGWTLDQVKPGTAPGGEYDAIYKPSDPSSKIAFAEVDVVIPNDPAMIDQMLQGLVVALRQQPGVAASPTDYYGDRIGAQATIGTDQASAQVYAFAVGNKLALVAVFAKPDGLDEAYDLADTLATAQETALSK
jgi:hypothetical protein